MSQGVVFFPPVTKMGALLQAPKGDMDAEGEVLFFAIDSMGLVSLWILKSHLCLQFPLMS